jgi:hypothetical protein
VEVKSFGAEGGAGSFCTLKVQPLNSKIDRLEEKLADPPHSKIKLDLDCFPEAEKILFRRVDEIAKEHRQTGSAEVLLKNSDLISKNLEVVLRRIKELYCHTVSKVLGCGEADGIVEYFFQLHFFNFEADLKDCLAHLAAWSKKDREAFALDLKDNKAVFFRIPRDLNDISDLDDLNDLGNEKEEKQENE